MDYKKKWFLSFSVRMLASYLILFLLYQAIKWLNGFYFLGRIEALLVYWFSSLLFPEIILVDGIIIQNLVLAGQPSSFGIVIAEICLGWFPIAGFVSMVIALPKTSLKKRLDSLKFGIPILFTANILRLVAIIWAAGVWGIAGFNFFHLVLIKFDLMLLVALLFYISVTRIIGKKDFLESVKLFSNKNKKPKRNN